MPDLNIEVELPETPPVVPPTTPAQSENSSTALEVGRLMEQMRTMETQVAEANARAESAEAQAREARETAEAANARAAEATRVAEEPEPIVEEPAIVPVVLEEVPVAPPAKKRGLIMTILLGR